MQSIIWECYPFLLRNCQFLPRNCPCFLAGAPCRIIACASAVLASFFHFRGDSPSGSLVCFSFSVSFACMDLFFWTAENYIHHERMLQRMNNRATGDPFVWLNPVTSVLFCHVPATNKQEVNRAITELYEQPSFKRPHCYSQTNKVVLVLVLAALYASTVGIGWQSARYDRRSPTYDNRYFVLLSVSASFFLMLSFVSSCGVFSALKKAMNRAAFPEPGDMRLLHV